MPRVAAAFVISLALFTVRAEARQQGPVALPEGAGKALVAARCVGCHDLTVAVSRRGTAEQWRDTIAVMVQRGAQIPDADAATMATYLAQHYGPTAAPAVQSATALPDGPGKDMLTSKCFQCHGQTMWNDLRLDRRGWEGVLYRMVGRRALWTEDEINTMAEYLARARGR